MKAATLFKVNPHCHWYGCLTMVLSFETATAEQRPFIASVDHFKSRFEAATREEWTSAENKVLACWRCNDERNRAFIKANPGAVVRVEDRARRLKMQRRNTALAFRAFDPVI